MNFCAETSPAHLFMLSSLFLCKAPCCVYQVYSGTAVYKLVIILKNPRKRAHIPFKYRKWIPGKH